VTQPVPVDERYRVLGVLVVLGVLALAFNGIAVATGHARWPDLLLPAAVLAVILDRRLRSSNPGLARCLIWAALLLVAGACVNALLRLVEWST
jgi:hypothetical protein